MFRLLTLFCCALAGAGLAQAAPAAAPPAPRADQATLGQQLYAQQCAACHSLDYNGVGPAHRGVFGRKAGSAPGYSYSAALSASGVVWNAQTLERWLTDPERFIPGQKMGFKVNAHADRAALIAYLKSTSAAP